MYTVYRYTVTNSAPRPESYLTDYDTVDVGANTFNETQRSHCMLHLFGNSTKLVLYNYKTRAAAQSTVFSVTTFYPLWSGIMPTELTTGAKSAFGYFSSLNLLLARYNGTYPSTCYIVLKAPQALPSNVISGTPPVPSENASTFPLITASYLEETQLPGLPFANGGNASAMGAHQFQ
ncbi:hypothetical protein FISHEDRAFT_78201 [Fistulina hepatica ATCC 64428]|nr:hypothetical protein FISHEDRAFT_78201 [Fistulina hepatica ATCC 64428]